MIARRRPGDLESKTFDLVVGEKFLFFDNPRVGWMYTPGKVFLKNPTKDRYTYKVKCTNNDLVDIRMPVGFIDPSEAIDIEVFHIPGTLIPENDLHHLSIYYIKCDMNAQEYGPIWKSRKPEGCKHIPIRFPLKQIVLKDNEMEKQKKNMTDKMEMEKRSNMRKAEF